MQCVQYQNGVDVSRFLQREVFDAQVLFPAVQQIMADVKRKGDEALTRYSMQFDGVAPPSLVFGRDEMQKASERVDVDLKSAIGIASANIRAFHLAQLSSEICVETSAGVVCSQRAVPIQRVGLYVPGGTATLFSSVLMLAIPAVLAGCSTIVLATPPDSNGRVPDVVLYAALVSGIEQVFCVGGVQAIAAMTYGTETISRVDKILGPGNQYVTAAKQLAFLQGVAIDMPAGPSEVAIIADESANSAFVAADLLSQAEHGADSQVVLICTSQLIIDEVMQALERQLSDLPRKGVAMRALAKSTCFKVASLDDAIELSNIYAPEHLILSVDNPEKLAQKVVNAGSVFLGNLTPESAGDYASGTNHTLPTNGAARAFSGVNIDAFQKKITFQQLSAEGVRSIGNAVVKMALSEQLQAHANAMQLRIDSLNNIK